MLSQFAQYYRNQDMPMHPGNNDSFGWIFLVGFLIISIIIGTALFITYKMATKQPTAIQENPAQTPIEIAKERYAKGEITKEEFADIKKALAE